jgi:3-oxoacyl-[acyl-carrier protein] reductase
MVIRPLLKIKKIIKALVFVGKENKMGLLEGKTAIITGAGTGIGLGIAKRFHEEGAKVVICGRRMDKLMEASSMMSHEGERVYPIRADVTVEDDIKRIVEEALEKTGKINILVNNAGRIIRFGNMETIDLALWDAVMNTNARGPWRLIVAVLPAMRKLGGGSIVNISSLTGLKAFPGSGMYGTSKAALQYLSQVMAVELGPENIRVNLICPGHVPDTELHFETVGKENAQKRSELMAALHPLGKNGTPKDVAEAALFLASDLTPWITGVIFSVDGGRHLATNRTASLFSANKPST